MPTFRLLGVMLGTDNVEASRNFLTMNIRTAVFCKANLAQHPNIYIRIHVSILVSLFIWLSSNLELRERSLTAGMLECYHES